MRGNKGRAGVFIGASALAMLGCSREPAEETRSEPSAIIGGTAESNYPPAGYLSWTGATSFCSATLVSANVVVTAAHCVSDKRSGGFYFGVADLSANLRARVLSVKFHPQDDLAALIIERPLFSPLNGVTPASLGSVDGHDACDFRDVGYGRTTPGGFDPNGYEGVRKSLRICFDYTMGEIFQGKNPNGGMICHGDSGSGVFVTGTTQLVAVTVSYTGPDGCTSYDEMQFETMSSASHRNWLNGIIAAPPSTQIFNDTMQGGGCENQCSNGAKQCIDGDRYQDCGDYNGDGCTEWSTPYSCGTSFPGTTCSDGWCVGPPPPTDQCSPGSKQCVDGDRYQDCGDYNGDGVNEWSSPYSCSASWPGTVCSDGWCVGGDPGGGGDPPPADNCGGANLDWDLYNCGSCGNSCPDQGFGSCNMGQCE
jgi:hypothetical protein